MILSAIAGEDLRPVTEFERSFGILVRIGPDHVVTRATGEGPGPAGYCLEYVKKGERVAVVLLGPLVTVAEDP